MTDNSGKGPAPRYGLTITLGNNVLLVIDEAGQFWIVQQLAGRPVNWIYMGPATKERIDRLQTFIGSLRIFVKE